MRCLWEGIKKLYGCGFVRGHGVRRRGLEKGVDVDGWSGWRCLGAIRKK